MRCHVTAADNFFMALPSLVPTCGGSSGAAA